MNLIMNVTDLIIIVNVTDKPMKATVDVFENIVHKPMKPTV